MKIESYKQGTPCWVDLSTRIGDLGVVKDFYTRLFGWEYRDNLVVTGQIYSLAMLGGSAIAGINALTPAQFYAWHEQQWNIFVAVDDIDMVASRIPALGGDVVIPPYNVVGAARAMSAVDPTGGIVAFWEANEHMGSELRGLHGTIHWAELVTNRPAIAGAFFVELLGMGICDDEAPSLDGDRCYALTVVSGPVSGIAKFRRRPGEFAIQPFWAKYFQVDDLDSAIATATSNGGKLLLESISAPNLGRVAKLQDPQGADFCIVEPRPLRD